MATINEFNLNSYNLKSNDLQAVWEALDSQILRVVDEDGKNIADCRIRHLLGKTWLCVDDMDGYTILDQSAVENLILVTDLW